MKNAVKDSIFAKSDYSASFQSAKSMPVLKKNYPVAKNLGSFYLSQNQAKSNAAKNFIHLPHLESILKAHNCVKFVNEMDARKPEYTNTKLSSITATPNNHLNLGTISSKSHFSNQISTAGKDKSHKLKLKTYKIN